jgi:nucleotide-binding universal stress UspA family protein
MTIIVPTDFSTTANNAAFYAGRMLTGNYDTSMVLFHVYNDPDEKDEVIEFLQQLKDEILSVSIVKIECRWVQSSDFIESLERLIRHLDARLVVMGISGKNKLEQVLFGSNTLKLVERNVCPVLMIPPAARFSEVKNVALTYDYKDVQTSLPLVPIKNTLALVRPTIHIVNVNSEHYISLTEEYLAKRGKLLEMFQEFNPEFYFIGTFDVEDTILQFVKDKNIDMLITVPRHRSLFNSIFKGSTTKKLAFESSIPILAVHE